MICFIISQEGYIVINAQKCTCIFTKTMFIMMLTKMSLFLFIEPGIPYNVSLVAYNEFGRGMPVEVTVFTRVLSKYMCVYCS